jgi:hypothetical protein
MITCIAITKIGGVNQGKYKSTISAESVLNYLKKVPSTNTGLPNLNNKWVEDSMCRIALLESDIQFDDHRLVLSRISGEVFVETVYYGPQHEMTKVAFQVFLTVEMVCEDIERRLIKKMEGSGGGSLIIM